MIHVLAVCVMHCVCAQVMTYFKFQVVADCAVFSELCNVCGRGEGEGGEVKEPTLPKGEYIPITLIS